MFVNEREKSASIRGATGTPCSRSACATPVRQQRLHAGPGGEDLERRHAARGGIAVVRGGDVAPQLAGDAPEGAETEHLHSVEGRARPRPDAGRSRSSRGSPARRDACTRRNSAVARSTWRKPSAIAGATPVSSLSASSAWSDPITPAAGPSTPASAQRGASCGAGGNAQR